MSMIVNIRWGRREDFSSKISFCLVKENQKNAQPYDLLKYHPIAYPIHLLCCLGNTVKVFLYFVFLIVLTQSAGTISGVLFCITIITFYFIFLELPTLLTKISIFILFIASILLLP